MQIQGRPTTIQIRHNKMLFFLGDHWVEIGPVEYNVTMFRGDGSTFRVPAMLPDVDAFFRSRLHLDDGTEDWRVWGPRVN